MEPGNLMVKHFNSHYYTLIHDYHSFIHIKNQLPRLNARKMLNKPKKASTENIYPWKAPKKIVS